MKYSEKEEENSTNTTLQIDKSSQFHEIDPTIQSENTSQSAESELMKDDLEKTSYIDSSQSAELTKPKLKELNLKKSEFDVGNLITCDSSSENGCNSSHHLGILSNPIDEIFLYVISQNDIPKKERDAFLDNTYFHWRSPKDFTSEKALDLPEEKKASKKKIPVVHNTVFEKPNDNEILKIQICPESTIELFNSNNFKIDSSIFYTTANPVRYYDVKTNKDNDTFFVTNETKRKDCYCHPLFQSYCFNKKNSYHFVAFSFDKYTAIKKIEGIQSIEPSST